MGEHTMELINMKVEHGSFGEGIVVECSDTVITVSFEAGTRKFTYPDALGTFLIPLDQKTADIVEERQKKLDIVRKQEELEAEKEEMLKYQEWKRSVERERLLKNHKLSPSSQAVFWCDAEEQEQVFSEWRVFTGLRKSGANEGKPNKLIRLHQNSVCLIVERTPEMKEEERCIKGFFMVNETFVGRLCESGFIPAHSELRFKFSEEESQKLLFWNYYVNDRSPLRMTWNSGKHRYFENEWMAQILRDVVALKEGTDDYDIAQKFFQHFCKRTTRKKRRIVKN